MTTNQLTRILTLPDPIKSPTDTSTKPTEIDSVAVPNVEDAVPGNTVPAYTQHPSLTYPVTLPAAHVMTSAAHKPTVPSMAVLDSKVSDILLCDEDLPVHSLKPVTPVYSAVQGEPSNPGKLVVDLHEPSPKPDLSTSAKEWFPTQPTLASDARQYPPGLNKNGIEWSVSDDSWMALEYGTGNTAVIADVEAAKPDINKFAKLKTLEVILPGGAVFDDKVLPPPSSPITPHKTYSKEYFLNLHMTVRSYGTYNYAGARAELKHSSLNIKLFREGLQDYDDIGVLSYLQYGFPVGLAQVFYLEPSTKNHSSSYQFYTWVDKFLAKGVSLTECAGPWSSPPVNPIMISPIMTADKDGSKRRTVFDATYGDFSLNKNTPEKEYLGEDYAFTFPSVLDLAELIVKTGKGCLLWKRDLSRWFLQIPIDPGDYDKLGFIWRGQFWLFTSYVWGTRHAGYAGQRVSSAILHIHKRLGLELSDREFQALVYMDDFAGCENGHTASISYNALGRLLKELGVQESGDKACPPSTIMRFLGVEFDTNAMCMRIDEDKRLEIQSLTLTWSRKTVATKQELQSILGKLIWVSKVVRFSRCFVSRLIALLKTLKFQTQKTTLPQSVKLDFTWWHRFLQVFNGVELLIPTTVYCNVLGDACPMGGGAWNEQAKEYFSRKFPLKLCDPKYPIHLKEFWIIILAARTWGHMWTGRRVAIYCDNESCVQTITHQKPSDPALQECLRELFYHACCFKFQPVLLRVSTKDNDIADFISRNHNKHDIEAKFLSKGFSSMKPVEITDTMFTFIGDW